MPAVTLQLCSVEGCSNVRAERNGLCTKHATRLRRHGDVSVVLNRKWSTLAEKDLAQRHSAMMARCYNANHDCYENYGGRGISVCDEWQNRETFVRWSLDHGYAKELTLDRSDSNGDYCPGNCRWVDRATQSRNRRTNVWIPAFGETKCLADWVSDERCTVSQQTIRRRLALGWTAEQAITATTLASGETEEWRKLKMDLTQSGWEFVGYKINDFDEKVAEFYHPIGQVYVECCTQCGCPDCTADERLAYELGREWCSDQPGGSD